MRIKKLLCMLLTLTLLFSGNVYADEGIGESGTTTTNPGDVELRYTNISSITSDLAILSSGTAICTGRHVMKKNLKSELVLHFSAGQHLKMIVFQLTKSGQRVVVEHVAFY